MRLALYTFLVVSLQLGITLALFQFRFLLAPLRDVRVLRVGTVTHATASLLVRVPPSAGVRWVDAQYAAVDLATERLTTDKVHLRKMHCSFGCHATVGRTATWRVVASDNEALAGVTR